MTPLQVALAALGAGLVAIAISAPPAYSSEADDDAILVPARKFPGGAYQSEQTRAMQRDSMGNPGLLWVAEGESIWNDAAGVSDSCATCHGSARRSMRGVAARYPAMERDRLLNLELRINTCRARYQDAAPFAYESDALLAITAYVAMQSTGVPVKVSIDGAARTWFERGRDFWVTRQGQLNLACRHCHQLNAGRKLRGDRISQGHGNGYPIYRLEWQTLGSLHRRFKACSAGVRAEMYPYGSDEYLALELFLAWRANGLAIETPAVRR